MHARIGCVILFVASAALAEETPVPACLEQIARPVYPPLSVQARIEGPVRVDFQVDADGRITNSRILEGHPLLVPSVAELLRVAKLDPASCGGKEFSVVYQFILEQPVWGPSPATYSFRGPNVLVIQKHTQLAEMLGCPGVNHVFRVRWRDRLRNLFR